MLLTAGDLKSVIALEFIFVSQLFWESLGKHNTLLAC